MDIAKSAFRVHGVDADGAVVIRRRIGRAKVLELFTDLRRFACQAIVAQRPRSTDSISASLKPIAL
jgi:hypothetical protein